MPHIKPFEAKPFAYNEKAIKMYLKFGCKIVGRTEAAVKNTDGSFNEEVIIHCSSPNFSEEALLRYHGYLLGIRTHREARNIKFTQNQEACSSDLI